MRIHYINIKTLLMVAVCVNFFLTSASFAQVSSENSLAGQISSDDIKIRESNKAEEIKNLLGKVTEDYQSLNGILLKETKLQVNSVDSQKPVSDNLNTIQKKRIRNCHSTKTILRVVRIQMRQINIRHCLF
ncbi:hypothetical protein SODG_005991 [Sodalis praecaptivus]